MGTLPIRILLVEPAEEPRSRLREMLAAAGGAHVVVTERSSVADALQASSEGRVDIALLSTSPGASNGYQSAFDFHEGAPKVPFVVVAATDDDTLALQVLQSGAQDVLVQDQFDSSLLFRTLHHAIERHELLAQLSQLLLEARAGEVNVRNIIGGSADGMIVVDAAGRNVFVNPAAERLMGRSAKSLRKQKLPFEVVAGHKCEIDLGEADLPEGAARGYLEVGAVELEWERKRAVLVTLRDLTDRKKAEDLRTRLVHADRLAAVGQLAAGVAHEINNPATFILANQTMLGENIAKLSAMCTKVREFVEAEGTPERRRQLEALLPAKDVAAILGDLTDMLADNTEGMHRIRSIVKDLRTFARVDQDDVELVQLGEVVLAACTMLSAEVEKRARLVRDLEKLPAISADRGKLAQVVMNLVLNAAQAIAPGAPERNQIRISTRRAGETVVVSVEDTGPGIPPAIRARIFEPFFTTKARDVGTGLGLSLCADIVKKHRGEIRVTSERGKGARFDVILPLDTGLSAPLRAISLPAPQARTRARLLLVDDEPTLLKAYRRMLESRCEVVVATGGAEALSLMKSAGPFDMILCDLMMPEIDGPMIYERICEEMPALAERVVFCSGGAFTQRAKEFMGKVSNVFLEKPVSRELLLAVIERVTGVRPLQIAARPTGAAR